MPEKSGTGIIIGRFQVFQLDTTHQQLIARVTDRHRKTLVFLGSNPAPTDRNPLHFVHREMMFEETYGDEIGVHEIPDLPDDRIWSQELDRRILELRPEGPVTLYGTTEELINRYSGRYPTEALEIDEDALADEIIWEGVVNQRDFRVGILFATLNRYPTVYPTVDIAVFRNDQRELLLARKENETRFRFPGGFADPSDDSYEMAAIRELMEECGDVDVEEMVYLGSCRIDDWRYRNSADSVITHFYACNMVGGEPVANDDIAEIRWFDVDRLSADTFVPEHRVLFGILEEFLQDQE
jgi:bifunctional NMN adenylyltransferase/nudix hydrolase